MNVLAQFLSDASRKGGSDSTWHTNNNMLGAKKWKRKISIPGAFQIKPEDRALMMKHLVSYFRKRDVETREMFVLTEIVNRYYTATLRLDAKIGRQDTWQNVPASIIFFDFDEPKKKNTVQRTDARNLRLDPLSRIPPTGTVVECIDPHRQKGAAGICLGGVQNSSTTNVMRVLLYPAFHANFQPRVVTAPVRHFRLGPYTMDEMAAVVQVIYMAFESVIESYRQASNALLAEEAQAAMGFQFQNESVPLRSLMTRIIWYTRVATNKRRFNFQLRMPDIGVPYPVLKAFSARASMMLNAAYANPRSAKTEYNIPSWCAQHLHGLVATTHNASSGSSKTPKVTCRVAAVEDSNDGNCLLRGPLNPDLTPSLRIPGMKKKGDLHCHYVPWAAFLWVQHDPIPLGRDADGKYAYDIIREYVQNLQSTVEAAHLESEASFSQQCRLGRLKPGHTFSSEHQKIAWDVIGCFMGPGGRAFPGKDRSSSVVCADLLWGNLMRDLCHESTIKAAKIMSLMSIFPSPTQLNIASRALFSRSVVSSYLPNAPSGGLGTGAATGSAAGAGAVIRRYSAAPSNVDIKLYSAVQSIVHAFVPVSEKATDSNPHPFQWGARPPYSGVPIRSIKRSSPGGDLYVTLDTTFCCRKAFYCRSLRGGYHGSNNARIVLYSSGLIRATCFSRNGACSQKIKQGVQRVDPDSGRTLNVKLFDQMGRWDEKYRSALQFSHSFRADMIPLPIRSISIEPPAKRKRVAGNADKIVPFTSAGREPCAKKYRGFKTARVFASRAEKK